MYFFWPGLKNQGTKSSGMQYLSFSPIFPSKTRITGPDQSLSGFKLGLVLLETPDLVPTRFLLLYIRSQACHVPTIFLRSVQQKIENVMFLVWILCVWLFYTHHWFVLNKKFSINARMFLLNGQIGYKWEKNAWKIIGFT